MHSRVNLSLCERIVERRSKGHCHDDQSLVIGVLSMGLLKLDAGDFCLCMRRLCKNLRISAKQKIDCNRVSYFQFESMVRNAGSLFTVHFGVLWGFIVNVSTYLSDSNLVDSASSIRLSQRLSHACLSINNFIRETANGSLYQL